MAGYSGTPLPKKLGITEGSTLALLGAPPGVIGGLPADVTVKRQAAGRRMWWWPSSPSGVTSSAGLTRWAA